MSDLAALECFETEESLVEQLSALVAGSASASFGYLHEFDNGSGIADLVSYKFVSEIRENIAGLAQISLPWIYPLRRMDYRKSFRLEDFADWVGVTNRTAQIALREYQMAGYCRQKNSTVWIKEYQPKPLVSEIVAFEAKLRDWKKALWQASRYRTYAHYSWVVLDDCFAKPAVEKVIEFRRLNIGLASIDGDMSLRVHYEPTKAKPLSDCRWWQSNALIAYNEKLSCS
jgi:hypothetical protein